MSMKYLSLLAGAVLFLASIATALGNPPGEPGKDQREVACEQDPFCPRKDWKEEFQRICAQTEVATALKAGQLEKLISDSDELLPRLEALPRDQARLYSFRLKNCRGFFVYAQQLQ